MMDTRKLRLREDGYWINVIHDLSDEERAGAAYPDVKSHVLFYAHKDYKADAEELVKRWNAYLEAMELLRWVVQAATIKGPVGTVARIIKDDVINRAATLTEGFDLLAIERAKERAK